MSKPLIVLSGRYSENKYGIWAIYYMLAEIEKAMKPGKNDIPIKIKISGIQLAEFQKHSWHMIEAFGLDTRVDNYKGKRAISFYSWDLDCILDVLDMVLNDEKEYPDKEDEGYLKLQELYIQLKNEYKTTYGR